MASIQPKVPNVNTKHIYDRDQITILFLYSLGQFSIWGPSYVYIYIYIFKGGDMALWSSKRSLRRIYEMTILNKVKVINLILINYIVQN